MPQTLFDKLWSRHIVKSYDDDTALIYIDRQLLHEVTSPQAFEGLRLKQRPLWNPKQQVAMPDHNVPTTPDRYTTISDPLAKAQLNALERNCQLHDVPYLPLQDSRQGIVHIVGPELGFTLPGMTLVCGDSHTSTHGALGCLAMGIGTSEVEQVLATQCLRLKKLRNFEVHFTGTLRSGVYAKDMILKTIREIGAAGGAGYAIEFTGAPIEAMSMEGRMTLCNMAIEAGARCGMVAVDETTLAYVKDRPFAPSGKAWDSAQAQWKSLRTDPGAHFDKRIEINVSDLRPQVSWGTSPDMVVDVNEPVPATGNSARALSYMNLQVGDSPGDFLLDHVFIGSCTNARIEDLREAAAQVRGRKVHSRIQQALVVPGSGTVKQQAESEGLHTIFEDAGFQWRESGCSMCIAMNPDRLNAGESCASTSNRNFEGRQGAGGRTHLVSPAMAARAAVEGHFVDISEEVV